MSKFTVVVSNSRHDSYDIEREILAGADAELVLANCTSGEELLEEAKNADGILLDTVRMSAEIVRGLNKCRVINRYGVGYDSVDVSACTERGIQLTNVPDYCAQDVSDHALALLLSCLRQTALRDRLMRQGAWDIPGASRRMEHAILGVIGMGRIGSALIKKVSGFGLSEVLVCDPGKSAGEVAALGAVKTGLDELLQKSDFISLHAPASDDTRGMINTRALSLMKNSAILINTSRGALVDDGALLAALQNGGIGFAGLDAHAAEPLPADSPYKKLDNVVLTDHNAYSSIESVRELKIKSARNVAAVLRGEKPPYCVNEL